MIRSVFDERLFVGDAIDARDAKLLFDNEIAAVVDVAANELPAQLPREIIYCRFPLFDGDGNRPELLRLAIGTVVNLIDAKYRTLVACSAGMSRSPAVAAAAVSVLTGQEMDDCLRALVKNGPHDVSPLLWKRVREAMSAGG